MPNDHAERKASVDSQFHGRVLWGPEVNAVGAAFTAGLACFDKGTYSEKVLRETLGEFQEFATQAIVWLRQNNSDNRLPIYYGSIKINFWETVFGGRVFINQSHRIYLALGEQNNNNVVAQAAPERDFPARCRAVWDWARAHGYAGGVPNFFQATRSDGSRVYGAILFKQGQHIDVPAWPNAVGVPERFRAATRERLVPNFHQANYGQGTVYGCLKLPPCTHRDIPLLELEQLARAPDDNPEALMRAVYKWSTTHGFKAAVPTFERACYDGVKVRGALCFSSDVVDWADVPVNDLFGD